jgi:hypothetical protein
MEQLQRGWEQSQGLSPTYWTTTQPTTGNVGLAMGVLPYTVSNAATASNTYNAAMLRGPRKGQ